MKPNKEAIRMSERATEHGKVHAVLLEWGYSESEIQRLLNGLKGDHSQKVAEENLLHSIILTSDVSRNADGPNRA